MSSLLYQGREQRVLVALIESKTKVLRLTELELIFSISRSRLSNLR